MHVSLTPKLEQFVREKVESGLYNNNSEVVREALRLLAEREELQREAIRKALDEGEEDLRSGRYTTYREDEIEKILDDAGWPSES